MSDNVDIAFTREQLARLVKELDPKITRKALKYALRREATRVRNYARKQFAAGGLRNGREIAKGIRGKVHKHKFGFFVALNPLHTSKKHPGEKFGYYKNHFDKSVPLALWYENGATNRRTHKKQPRGGIKGIHALARAESLFFPKAVKSIEEVFEKRIIKLAERYGRL